VPRRKLIDDDKFGVTLEKCNRTRGWVVKVHCVRKDGLCHHGVEITVIFVIKPGDAALPPNAHGSIEHPQCWIRCLHAVGTTTNIVQFFCDYVCHDIETNNILGTDFCRILICDNLTAHLSAYVNNTVTGGVGPSNFSIVPQPPYHPKHCPIKCKICEVMEKIRLKKEDNWDMNWLEQEIKTAAHQIKRFDETFIHCGYTWN
jgi:hypothetical protein